jgi:hypothetical protein
MGVWSGEPFGNDTAADWAWELDDQRDWQVVDAALNEAANAGEYIDADIASNAIAAAETVAHGLGRATQDDAYTDSVTAFVARAPKPSDETVQLALAALAAASGPNSELTELWAESAEPDWSDANARIKQALTGP